MQTTIKIKFNWGHGLLIFILMFLATMGMMVYVAMQQRNDMVDEHYYQKEMAYQGLLDAKQNLNKLSGKSIFVQDESMLRIEFPAGSSGFITDGKIELIRTDNSDLDLDFNLSNYREDAFIISKSQLQQGMYKVRAKWTSQDHTYYAEENMYLQK